MIKLTLIIIFMVVSWLVQRAKKNAESLGDSSRPEPRPLPPNASPQGNADEQVRRIQEEIRRKIMERANAGGAAQPAPPALPRPLPTQPTEMPRPSTAPATRTAIPPPRRVASSSPRPTAAEIAEKASSERALTEQTHRVDVERREAKRVARAVLEGQISTPATAGTIHTNFRDELRDPASVRRAIVLRELLSPPLSLR